MIEALMYIGIGLLVGCLIGLAIIPLVHDRAVRLTVRRMEATLPRSFTEIQADKDLLRADFAVSTRRLEILIEQLRTRSVSQLVELSRKTDLINRLKSQRDALKVEILGLNAQLAAAKKERNIPYDRKRTHVPAVLRHWIPQRLLH
jgi:hypothetical protein